jgi:FHA domain
MANCPKGHLSTELDYCSECGTKMLGDDSSSPISAAPINNLAAHATDTISCPACSAPHHADDGKFCEICGYNFSTGQAVDLSVATLTPPSPAVAPISTETVKQVAANQDEQVSSPAQNISITGWQITIRIDPALATTLSPPAPVQVPIQIPLNKTTSLIGRTSVAKGVMPDIPLDFDDAVSHRHALLIVQADGSLVVRDIGSSNGVQFQDDDLETMADVPLQHGDVFCLGHWTTIEVQKQ